MQTDESLSKIKEFLESHNLSTNDIDSVRTAFTHPSFTNEHGLDYTQNYERLEFLGDSVLKLISSKYLFNKYPDFHEGDLTKIRSSLVSDLCLARIARDMKLDELLILGNVEFKNHKNIPDSVIACSFEALLGALYISSSLSSIEGFLMNIFEEVIDEIQENTVFINAKAILQEYTQSQDKTLPEYNQINEFGPEHNKTFEVEVSYNGELLGKGTGKTKKEAQQNAAVDACKKLNLINSSGGKE